MVLSLLGYTRIQKFDMASLQRSRSKVILSSVLELRAQHLQQAVGQCGHSALIPRGLDPPLFPLFSLILMRKGRTDLFKIL